MYTLLFLDFHLSAPCNARMLTSSLDLDWELPFSITLWEADTAETWSGCLGQEPRVQAFLGAEDGAEPPCPSTRSLALATQSLMTATPSPDLMVALATSPVATLFVLTNIDAFVRDFTRCYYQMPPTPADPSAFHIFTQSQNKQVIAALRHISRVIPDRNSADDNSGGGSNPYRPIWRAIECTCLAVKIALYKPDDLLIGGIVDTTVVAGLATATHLTLGRYSGTRRSLEALMQNKTGDDAVIMILDEAMALLSFILGSDTRDAQREPPWATMASYRIVLAIWRSLRWAASEVRAREAAGASQGLVRRRFETPSVIFHAIMDVAMEETAVPQAPGHNGAEQLGGLDALLDASPELGEACYAKAVLEFWRKRSVWPIGASMATVLEEIVSDEYPGLVDSGVAAWWNEPAAGLA